MHLEQEDEEMVDGEDDEDFPMKLSTLIATEGEKGNLPTGYKSLGNGIVYDEAWDETAKLLNIDEVEGAIKSREAEDGRLGKSDVKESEIEESGVGEGQVEGSEVGASEVAKGEAGESGTEESNHFEDCN